jgi:hypothetical protein
MQIEDQPLTDHGIHFSRKPLRGWRKFTYTWQVTKDNVERMGKTTIYCQNSLDFLRLLNVWNHSDYKYLADLGQPLN